MAALSAQAQVSQRARQLRERAACEADLPTCRPEIRVQLEAERSRIRWGLSGLGVLVLIGGILLIRRFRALKHQENKDLRHLQSTLQAAARDSAQNQAKSTNDD